MPTFDFDFSKCSSTLEMEGPTVIATNAKGEPIVAYVNEFKGVRYGHIRSLYQDKSFDNRWCPGKGISFLADEMQDVILRLAERFVEAEEAPPAPPQIVSLTHDTVADAPWTDPTTKPTAAQAYGFIEEQAKRAEASVRTAQAQIDKVVAAANKVLATPTEAQWKDLLGLSVRLSPENLSCDGELNRGQIKMRRSAIMKEWRAIEKAVGRMITEDEVYEWERSEQRVATEAKAARRRIEKRRSR